MSYENLKKYLSNPENKAKHYGRCRQWQASNPDKFALTLLKARAKRQGIDFDITLADIPIPDKCPVLGFPLIRSAGKGPSYQSPTVDRIDPGKGYIPGNVQVISHLANRMKNSADREQLLAFARWVIKTYDAHEGA